MTAVATARQVVSRVTATVAYTTDLRGAYGETPAAPWVEAPDLLVSRLELLAGGVDRCFLAEPYGQEGLVGVGASGQRSALPVELEGKYVRVTIPLDEADGGVEHDATGAPDVFTRTWYGYIPQGSRTRRVRTVEEGNPPAEVSKLSGVQQWQAVGLEWFLGRQQITDAVVSDRSPGAGPTAVARIGRPLAFNGGLQSASVDRNAPRGNKSQTKLAFASAETVLNRPRALAVAAANYEELTQTLALVGDAAIEGMSGSRLTYLRGLRRLLAPDDLDGTELTHAADVAPGLSGTDDFRGVVGDLVRLIQLGDDTAWEIDKNAATEWNGESMIRYLLRHHAPADRDGEPAPCGYVLEEGGDLLRTFKPTVPTENRTVLELLEAIANPRRGVLLWTETVTPDEDATITEPEVRLRVASLATEAIGLPSGAAFPASTRQIELDPDSDPFAGATVLSDNLRQRYDRVRCRGARVTSTFTIGTDDGSLIPDWTGEAMRSYFLGASEEDDYPDGDDERKRANDRRRAEPDLADVFTRYKLNPLWGGKIIDRSTASDPPLVDAFPQLDLFNSVVITTPHLPSLQTMRRTRLPALVGEADAFAPIGAYLGRDTHNLYSGENPSNSTGERLYPLNNLADLPLEDGSRRASYSVRRIAGPGVVLRIGSTKGLAHTFQFAVVGLHPGLTQAVGDTEWVSPSGEGSDLEVRKQTVTAARAWPYGDPRPPSADFDTNETVQMAPSRVAGEAQRFDTLIITLTCEADDYAAVTYSEVTMPTTRPIEELVVDLGPEFRADLIAKGTVTGVKNGVPEHEPDSRYLRDDRPAMELIAAMAYAWYKNATRAIRLQIQRPTYLLSLGDLVTTLGRPGEGAAAPEPVGTAVSEIAIDFARQTTTIQTVGVEGGGLGAIGGIDASLNATTGGLL